MTTELPRAQLIDLVQGLSEFPARWEGEVEQEWGIWETKPGVYSELSITGYTRLGVDEYRQDYDAKVLQLKSTMSGQRQFTLTIKAKSYEIGKLPTDILERIRLRLGSVSAHFILQDAGLAIVRALPIVPLPPEKSEEDNRYVFSAAMDIRFGFAVSEEAGDDEGTTIETADLVPDLLPDP